MSLQPSQPRALLTKWGPLAGMCVLLALLAWSLTTRGGPKEEVVARVNGQPITQRQLWQSLEETSQSDPQRREMEGMIAVRLVQEELARHKLQMTQDEYTQLASRADSYFRSLTPTDSRSLGLQTLDSLILHQLVRQEARKRGVSVSPEELESRVQSAKDDILARTGLSFVDWLKATGQTEAEYRDHLSLQILTGRLVLPDRDRKQFFEANKDRLKQLPQNNESVIYRQIVVAKKEDAEAIRKQLLAGGKGGADFAKMAEDRSLDAMTRSRGGMVGWAVKGKRTPPDPDLDKILFTLKPGEMSQPLPVNPSGVTDKGEKPSFWRLVKVEKHVAPHEMTMEANARTIEEAMASDSRFQSLLGEFYDNLRGSAKVEFPSARYRALGDYYSEIRRMQEQMSQPAPASQQPQAPQGGAPGQGSRQPARSGVAPSRPAAPQPPASQPRGGR